jgi:hypothetical protein
MVKYPLVRKIYLYTFSLVGLVLITIGSVRLVNLALKVYVFTKADQYYDYPVIQPAKPEAEPVAPSKQQIEEFQKNQRTSQRQRDAAESLAMIIIGIPLFLYHWSRIKKDQKEEISS